MPIFMRRPKELFFSIHDETGQIKSGLTVNSTASTLTLDLVNDKPITQLVGGIAATGLYLHNRYGQERASLTHFSEVMGPSLKLTGDDDGSGKMNVTLFSSSSFKVLGLSIGNAISLSTQSDSGEAGLSIAGRGSFPVSPSRIHLGMKKNEGISLQPALEIRDEKFSTRAVIGVTRLVDKKTGEKIARPESSLVLFNEDGNVLRSIP